MNSPDFGSDGCGDGCWRLANYSDSRSQVVRLQPVHGFMGGTRSALVIGLASVPGIAVSPGLTGPMGPVWPKGSIGPLWLNRQSRKALHFSVSCYSLQT
ncbi:MAG: hypothetical protein RL215_486, partial [Planctomycetota bacterium]